MKKPNDYSFLTDFWDEVLEPAEGRRWQVLVGRDSDLLMRDPVAYFEVRKALLARDDVEFIFLDAFGTGASPIALPRHVDLLTLGRMKPLLGSLYGAYASWFEGKTVVKFLDSKFGSLGDVLRVGEIPRPFSRRAIGEGYAGRRRFDRDYGLILYRHQTGEDGIERRMLVLGGLGILGTACTAIIVSNPGLRGELRRQAETLAPYEPRYMPDHFFELVIRVQVRDETELAEILNRLEEWKRGGPRPFEFELEAMAVSDLKGMPICAALRPRRLSLQFAGENDVLLPGCSNRLSLGRNRRRLLEILHDSPGGRPVDELCQELEIKRGYLWKLVFDTNSQVADAFHPSHKEPRLIVGRRGRYALNPDWTASPVPASSNVEPAARTTPKVAAAAPPSEPSASAEAALRRTGPAGAR